MEPPIVESLFCDALLSVVTGEELKAVLELGVSAETAITELLLKTADIPPATPKKRKFLANQLYAITDATMDSTSAPATISFAAE